MDTIADLVKTVISCIKVCFVKDIIVVYILWPLNYYNATVTDYASRLTCCTMV